MHSRPRHALLGFISPPPLGNTVHAALLPNVVCESRMYLQGGGSPVYGVFRLQKARAHVKLPRCTAVLYIRKCYYLLRPTRILETHDTQTVWLAQPCEGVHV